MTKIYSNNFQSADPQKALESYKSNGVFILKNVFKDQLIDSLRNKLDSFYSESGDKRLRDIVQIKKDDINFYLNFFLNEKLEKFFEKVFNNNQTNNKNYILPPMHFAKNYLPHSKFTRLGGWHRDCGGELQYKECRKLISNKNYIFGKVGIYCQDNGEYGGGIDVIPRSNLDFNKNYFRLAWGTVGIKVLRISQILSKNLHKFLTRNLIFQKIFSITKLDIKKGDVAFFDARIWHKGSYALINVENNLDYDHSKLQANLPSSFKKYVLYSHFGNELGIKSYLVDRDRRVKKNNIKESTKWLNEISFVYDNNSYFKNSINNKKEIEKLIYSINSN